MTRPLRLEFPGALYHVTARGNRSTAIYRDDADRRVWLAIVGKICERYRCVIHSFCQMGNHYHLLIETDVANLSTCIQQLNGLYSRYFNRRHSVVGHMFQGRYKAILVQKESYLLELSRYIVLNPVRAHIVSSPEDWPWSSFHYFVTERTPPRWMARDWLLSQFSTARHPAISAFRAFVLAGVGKSSPLAATRHRILLGDDAFVEEHQHLDLAVDLAEAAKPERQAVTVTLKEYQMRYDNRNEAMARAYLSTVFTMPQIADCFGVSTKTVSRAVAAFEKEKPGNQG